MTITKNARFIAELAARLVKDVEAHEEDRVKSNWSYHAGRSIPEKKVVFRPTSADCAVN